MNINRELKLAIYESVLDDEDKTKLIDIVESTDDMSVLEDVIEVLEASEKVYDNKNNIKEKVRKAINNSGVGVRDIWGDIPIGDVIFAETKIQKIYRSILGTLAATSAVIALIPLIIKKSKDKKLKDKIKSDKELSDLSEKMNNLKSKINDLSKEINKDMKNISKNKSVDNKMELNKLKANIKNLKSMSILLRRYNAEFKRIARKYIDDPNDLLSIDKKVDRLDDKVNEFINYADNVLSNTSKVTVKESAYKEINDLYETKLAVYEACRCGDISVEERDELLSYME